MARLRIRIELNRGGVGVPLQKLASVVAESQQFFRMLGEDTQIDQQSGEWLGFDFDHESLNFTAEFVGPVTSEQVTAFYAAFDGTTSLRRATIAQFARITESIEGDELIGFGLYLSEVGAEPAEWRCLSRRDALRIAEEIRVLAGEDEFAVQSHLPAVTDSGARIFSERRESERRERGIEPSRFAGMVRSGSDSDQAYRPAGRRSRGTLGIHFRASLKDGQQRAENRKIGDCSGRFLRAGYAATGDHPAADAAGLGRSIDRCHAAPRFQLDPGRDRRRGPRALGIGHAAVAQPFRRKHCAKSSREPGDVVARTLESGTAAPGGDYSGTS